MRESFQGTELYKRTLADHHCEEDAPDANKEPRDRLRASLLSFRENAAAVVSRIAASIPFLTQHEVSHLDGLWNVADNIIGPDFPVNPLEAYVFGCAVLLHDAALCPEAYDGGLDGLRSSIAWKDAFAIEAQSCDVEDEAIAASDFSALRQLNATQASKLGSMSWPGPDTNEPLFLIEDAHIRKHLSDLIGTIAASHHWSIEEVNSRSDTQFNAPAEFPRE